MKRFYYIAILGLSIFSLQSCFKTLEVPEMINEEELISTVIITLTSPNNQEVILSYQDFDGEGSLAPIVEVSGVLKSNSLYTGSIKALNETVYPTIDMTEEIIEEGLEHQFFYLISGLDASISPTDKDENGNDLGTTFQLQTGNSSRGTIQFLLRHKPQKPNDGNPDTAGGETDLLVSFSLVISN